MTLVGFSLLVYQLKVMAADVCLLVYSGVHQRDRGIDLSACLFRSYLIHHEIPSQKYGNERACGARGASRIKYV